MKTRLIILIGLLPFVVMSQDFNLKRDKLFWKEMNVYRKFNNLPALKWDSALYEMAKFHSNYQVATNTTTHIEVQKVKNTILLPTIRDRFYHFLPNTIMHWCGENVLGGIRTIVVNDTTQFGKWVQSVFEIQISKLDADHLYVLYDLWEWSISPVHNANLLSTDCTTGAYALKTTSYDYFEHSIFYQNQPSFSFEGVSTMDLAE